jgi:hypothetical protein
MPDQTESDAWIKRVLGVEVAGGAPRAAGTKVAFQKLRLDWDTTRKYLMSQIKTLESAIIAQSADEDDAPQIADNVTRLEDSMTALDENLSDALDDLYNAGGNDPKLQARARDIARGYQTFITSAPLLQELDDNPFQKLDARARLDQTLTAIIGAL